MLRLFALAKYYQSSEDEENLVIFDMGEVLEYFDNYRDIRFL